MREGGQLQAAVFGARTAREAFLRKCARAVSLSLSVCVGRHIMTSADNI